MWEKIIQQVHEEVDEMRRQRGLPPYQWKQRANESRLKYMEMNMLQNEKYEAVRAKYAFVVDLKEERFDGLKHESVKIDGVEVVVPKLKCVKCGGPRHALETKGFCPKCRIELGMYVAPATKSKVLGESNWESKRHKLAHPEIPIPIKVASVNEEFINFAWESLNSTSQNMIMKKVWNALPLADKVKYIEEELKEIKQLANSTVKIELPPPIVTDLEHKVIINKYKENVSPIG